MELVPLATDNVSDLLLKIVEFTRLREEILERNIDSAHMEGFVPHDLPLDEFCEVLDCAVVEHVQSERLLLRDTRNVKFGAQGKVYVRPIVDGAAQQVLAHDVDQFVKAQQEKLDENALNRRLALELLGAKEGFVGAPVHCITRSNARVRPHSAVCWDQTSDGNQDTDS